MAKFTTAEFVKKVADRPGGPRGPRKRTEEQKPWDAHFEQSMSDGDVVAVVVGGEGVTEADFDAEVKDARTRIVSAARFFGKAVTEGQPQPGSEPDTIVLAWKIRTPKPRDKDSVE